MSREDTARLPPKEVVQVHIKDVGGAFGRSSNRDMVRAEEQQPAAATRNTITRHSRNPTAAPITDIKTDRLTASGSIPHSAKPKFEVTYQVPGMYGVKSVTLLL